MPAPGRTTAAGAFTCRLILSRIDNSRWYLGGTFSCVCPANKGVAPGSPTRGSLSARPDRAALDGANPILDRVFAKAPVAANLHMRDPPGPSFCVHPRARHLKSLGDLLRVQQPRQLGPGPSSFPVRRSASLTSWPNGSSEWEAFLDLVGRGRNPRSAANSRSRALFFCWCIRINRFRLRVLNEIWSSNPGSFSIPA